MRLLVTAAAALGLALASPAFASEDAGGASYAPRDECREQPGAAAFLDALASAVEARDSAALAALAADDVLLDFGGGEGRDELRARLDGAVEGYGDLWSELATVLSLGCAADAAGAIFMPWYFAQDQGFDDPYSAMLVTGRGVALLESASGSAKVTRAISWEFVELVDGFFPDREYQQVRSADGTQGYIATASLRSLLDYRLRAEKTGAGWRIVAFIAGD